MSTFCDSTFPLFGEANEATIPFAPPETPVLFSYLANESKKPRRFALMTSFYAIIGNTQLCTLSEEKDLIWKFRFYLARDTRGLSRFLRSVTWRDPSKVKQAVEEHGVEPSF